MILESKFCSFFTSSCDEQGGEWRRTKNKEEVGEQTTRGFLHLMEFPGWSFAHIHRRHRIELWIIQTTCWDSATFLHLPYAHTHESGAERKQPFNFIISIAMEIVYLFNFVRSPNEANAEKENERGNSNKSSGAFIFAISLPIRSQLWLTHLITARNSSGWCQCHAEPQINIAKQCRPAPVIWGWWFLFLAWRRPPSTFPPLIPSSAIALFNQNRSTYQV